MVPVLVFMGCFQRALRGLRLFFGGPRQRAIRTYPEILAPIRRNGVLDSDDSLLKGFLHGISDNLFAKDSIVPVHRPQPAIDLTFQTEELGVGILQGQPVLQGYFARAQRLRSFRDSPKGEANQGIREKQKGNYEGVFIHFAILHAGTSKRNGRFVLAHAGGNA